MREPDFLTIQQAADAMDVEYRSVLRYIHVGKLAAQRGPGDRWYVTCAEVERWKTTLGRARQGRLKTSVRAMSDAECERSLSGRDYVSVALAARALGVLPVTILRRVWNGEMAAQRGPADRWLITRAEVERWRAMKNRGRRHKASGASSAE